MSQSQRVSLKECFSTLTDPRRRKVMYPLVNIGVFPASVHELC